MTGRLIGGCQNTLTNLVGTEFAPVYEFNRNYAAEDGLIWYLESVDWGASDIYRSLWQMKMNGWFENTNGVLIGRSIGYSPTKDFELEDALDAVFNDLNIPVVYDVDIGHLPPQLVLVNGAFAEIEVSNGKGKVEMVYK